MRKIFGKWITEKAKEDKGIILLVGDIGFGIFDEFKRNNPDRFYNIGLIEQSMISIASGLATQGLKPYIYSITPFLIERAFEQVKLDVSDMELNVKIVGYSNYPTHGLSHTEVLTPEVLRPVLKIECYEVKTEEETIKALEGTYAREVPAYISLK